MYTWNVFVIPVGITCLKANWELYKRIIASKCLWVVEYLNYYCLSIVIFIIYYVVWMWSCWRNELIASCVNEALHIIYLCMIMIIINMIESLSYILNGRICKHGHSELLARLIVKYMPRKSTHTHTHTHIYIHTHIDTHIYSRTYIYIYTYTHIYVYVCMHIYVYVCLYIYIYICIYVCVYIYIYIYICICIYVCMYIYVCVCVYIYMYMYVCIYTDTYIYIHISLSLYI